LEVRGARKWDAKGAGRGLQNRRARAETVNRNCYCSGEIDVRPQSSHRRYTTGYDSERPITFALGTPHRGQIRRPDVDRFAMKNLTISKRRRREEAARPLIH